MDTYRHYKGNMYEFMYEANHSETLEKLVVYRALYGTKEVWVRPYNMFFETVTIDGKTIPRFEKIKIT